MKPHLTAASLPRLAIGQLIRLHALTKHGRDRINQHGMVYLIHSIAADHLTLESTAKTFKLPSGNITTDIRNVKFHDDPDFHMNLIE